MAPKSPSKSKPAIAPPSPPPSRNGLSSPSSNSASSPLQSRTTKITHFVFGGPSTQRRTITNYFISLVLSLLVHEALTSPKYPIFGQMLDQNIGPVLRGSGFTVSPERLEELGIAAEDPRSIDGGAGEGGAGEIKYWVIVLEWMWEFLISVQAWKWERVRERVDTGVLAALISLVARTPFYFFLDSHFLIPTRSISHLLLTDITSIASGLLLYSALTPSLSLPFTLRKRAPPRAVPNYKPLFKWTGLLSVFLAIALATTLSTLASYLALLNPLQLESYFRKHTQIKVIPSALSSSPPPPAIEMAKPYIHVPILKPPTQATGDEPFAPFPRLILESFALTILSLVLYLFVFTPSHVTRSRRIPSIRNISLLLPALTVPATFFSLWNLFPVDPKGAGAIAAQVGFRAALVAAVSGWVMFDVRREMMGLNKDPAKEGKVIRSTRGAGMGMDGGGTATGEMVLMEEDEEEFDVRELD